MTARRSVLALAVVVVLAVVAVLVAVAGRAEPADLGAPRAASGGAEDLVYGADGLVRLAIGDGRHEVADAVPAAEGGLFVLGRARTNGDEVGFVLRLGPDGAPSADFGTAGVATLGRWAPDRLAATGDGAVVVVAGVTDAVLVWRGDERGRSEAPHTVAVPVPEGDVATGVRISDVVVDGTGAMTVAGGIHVNREEHVGGCCAIEPDSIPFRLRLGRDGEPDEAFGPDGFVLQDLQEGEGVTAGPLADSATREHLSPADADAARGELGFLPAVVVAAAQDQAITVGIGSEASPADTVVVARSQR